MPTLTDREALLAAILRDPDDWATYRVLADWLEDNGETRLACAYRWMAGRQKRPHHRLAYTARPGEMARSVPDKYSWAWYSEAASSWHVRVAPIPAHARLRRLEYLSMGSGSRGQHLHHSWNAAVDGLAEGLAALENARSVEGV